MQRTLFVLLLGIILALSLAGCEVFGQPVPTVPPIEIPSPPPFEVPSPPIGLPTIEIPPIIIPNITLPDLPFGRTPEPTVAPAPTATQSPSATSAPAASPTTGTGATATSTPLVQGEWKAYDRPDAGFSLSLPPEFQDYSTKPEDLDREISQLKTEDPQVATGLEGLKTLQIIPDFFAYDLSNESRSSGYLANASVARQPLKYPVPLSLVVPIYLNELQKIPYIEQPVAHERMKTSHGEFERFEYRLKAQGDAKAGITFQLLGIGNGQAYVLTLSCAADQADKYRAIFEKVGESFELK